MRLVEGVVEVEDVDDFLGRIRDVRDATGATVQAFDARYVVSRAHLERAVELADRARRRDENVARDRAVEILLYVAGQRQINRALELGVAEGENRVVVLVEGGDEEAAADEIERFVDTEPTLGEFDPALVREHFDVNDAELDAVDGDLADVVLERVALLDVEK